MKYVKPEVISFSLKEVQEIISASATICGICFGGYESGPEPKPVS